MELKVGMILLIGLNEISDEKIAFGDDFSATPRLRSGCPLAGSGSFAERVVSLSNEFERSGEQCRTISRATYLYNFLRCQKGFTLIELLLVLVLLVVVIGLAAPNFSSTYNRLQLQRTVQDLGYLMRYAQSRAVIKQSSLHLEFDSEYKAYWLMEKVKGQERDEGGAFERLTGRLGRRTTINDEINIEAEGHTISFYPDGKIDKQHLRLCNDRRCFMISTKEQRGKVLIFEDELVD